MVCSCFILFFVLFLSHFRRLQLKPGDIHDLPKTLEVLHLKPIVDQLPETFVATSTLVAMAPLEASLEPMVSCVLILKLAAPWPLLGAFSAKS